MVTTYRGKTVKSGLQYLAPLPSLCFQRPFNYSPNPHARASPVHWVLDIEQRQESLLS